MWRGKEAYQEEIDRHVDKGTVNRETKAIEHLCTIHRPVLEHAANEQTERLSCVAGIEFTNIIVNIQMRVYSSHETVDIQHKQCPCRLFNYIEIQTPCSQIYATAILHKFCSNRSGRCNGMSSNWIRQTRQTHSMQYSKYKKQKQTHQKQIGRREKNSRAPPRGTWQTLENNE